MVPNVFRLVFGQPEHSHVRSLRMRTRFGQNYLTDLVPYSFSTGTAGPAFFSLGVRDAIVIIVVTDLV